MWEMPLAGGLVNAVTRVGDTVRRLPSANAGFVWRLLAFLEERNWTGAPRFLGVDDREREVLTYLPGHVAWADDQPAAVTSDDSLARVAALTRELHDLTAGTPLAADGEVVCHNDLSPRNTVYRDAGGGLRPVAFLDWDLAWPGERIHDVAHVCWQFLRLGPGVTDLAEARRRLWLVADAYGLSAEERPRLVGTILWWQDRCWRGIEAAARAGEPAARRLRDSGAVEEVRAAHGWTARHLELLDAGPGTGP
jgi:hypothetical protein